MDAASWSVSVSTDSFLGDASDSVKHFFHRAPRIVNLNEWLPKEKGLARGQPSCKDQEKNSND
jgi:hypothetical protein